MEVSVSHQLFLQIMFSLPSCWQFGVVPTVGFPAADRLVEFPAPAPGDLFAAAESLHVTEDLRCWRWWRHPIPLKMSKIKYRLWNHGGWNFMEFPLFITGRYAMGLFYIWGDGNALRKHCLRVLGPGFMEESSANLERSHRLPGVLQFPESDVRPWHVKYCRSLSVGSYITLPYPYASFPLMYKQYQQRTLEPKTPAHKLKSCIKPLTTPPPNQKGRGTHRHFLDASCQYHKYTAFAYVLLCYFLYIYIYSTSML